MLDETRLEELRRQYVKIGVIDWEGHQLVFRRPSRDEVHHYRMQRDGSPDERGRLAGGDLHLGGLHDGDVDHDQVYDVGGDGTLFDLRPEGLQFTN